jgi:hypothetical protein
LQTSFKPIQVTALPQESDEWQPNLITATAIADRCTSGTALAGAGALPRRICNAIGVAAIAFTEAGEMIEYQARNRKSAARRTGVLSGPTAADCGRALAEAVAAAAGDEPHPDQRTAAQSPAKFDITISRFGPPVPDDAGGGLPALVFDLQRLAVEQTIDESFREPADSLPRYPRLCDEAAPRWPGPPGQSDRQLPVWRLVSVQTERLFLPQLDRDYSFAPTPLLPKARISPLSAC